MDSPWAIVGRVTSEGDLERLQEFVHAKQQGHWRVGKCFDAGFTLEHDDHIGQIGSHDEIVLNNKGRLLRVENVAVENKLNE